MIARVTIIGACALAILQSTRDAIAVEPLSTRQLAQHCTHYFKDREGKDAIFCVRYIQGFIDGAVATDERVIQNIATELGREETYTERVIRTRLGSRVKRFGATVYAGFCLGAAVPLKVVEAVVHNLMNRRFIEEQLLARDAVFAALRKQYPCEADAKGGAAG